MALLALAVWLFFVSLHWIASLIFNKVNCDFLLFIPPALLFACVSLIAVDNFTYTVFKFGIITTISFARIIYTGIFLTFFILATILLAKDKTKLNRRTINIYSISAGTLLGISLLCLVITLFTKNVDLENIVPTDQKAASLPNIIFLSTDGLNASEMSAYGYAKETTPFIKELAATSLISENNFTNVGHTMGSITSVLTGKLAFDTNVLFPPDILRGSDTFEHLPGDFTQFRLYHRTGGSSLLCRCQCGPISRMPLTSSIAQILLICVFRSTGSQPINLTMRSISSPRSANESGNG